MTKNSVHTFNKTDKNIIRAYRCFIYCPICDFPLHLQLSSGMRSHACKLTPPKDKKRTCICIHVQLTFLLLISKHCVCVCLLTVVNGRNNDSLRCKKNKNRIGHFHALIPELQRRGSHKRANHCCQEETLYLRM